MKISRAQKNVTYIAVNLCAFTVFSQLKRAQAVSFQPEKPIFVFVSKKKSILFRIIMISPWRALCVILTRMYYIISHAKLIGSTVAHKHSQWMHIVDLFKLFQ